MSHPMYFWYITVGIVLLAFLVNFIHYLMSHRQHGKRIHIFGICREREFLFIPGDKREDEDDEFDD